MVARTEDPDVTAVEDAMVAIRRRMSRRSLGRLARLHSGARPPSGADPGAGMAFDVLDVLEAAERTDAQATVSGVAEALGVDQPRASRLVAAAVDAGFVRRLADRSDGRRVVLVRTARGRAMSDKVHQFRRSVFAAAMSSWSRADTAAFAHLLTRFVHDLGDLDG
jgi:DNA-binding MarR family transcriptional regulator